MLRFARNAGYNRAAAVRRGRSLNPELERNSPGLIQSFRGTWEGICASNPPETYLRFLPAERGKRQLRISRERTRWPALIKPSGKHRKSPCFTKKPPGCGLTPYA